MKKTLSCLISEEKIKINNISWDDFNCLPNEEFYKFNYDKLKNLFTDNFKTSSPWHERDSESKWAEAYKIIQGADWPVCNSFEEFDRLPENIKNECQEVHNFSPDIWLQNSVIETKTPDYWGNTLIGIKKIILDNLEIIKNKHVVEFSCLSGNYAGTMLHLGARSVVSTDIRKESCEIAKESLKVLGYQEPQYTVRQADIHDYATNTSLCENKETVLLCGIMYHVADHYNILKSITTARPKYVIIDTEVNENIMDLSTPLVFFREECTTTIMNAWEDQKDIVLVGLPNEAWFKTSMQLFGYKLTKSSRHLLWDSAELDDRFRKHRSVMVFEMRE